MDPTCVWSHGEGVEPARLAKLVQDVQVGVDVVAVVVVGRVVLEVPLLGRLHVLRRPPLRLALVIHHVKAHHLHSRQCDQLPHSYGLSYFLPRAAHPELAYQLSYLLSYRSDHINWSTHRLEEEVELRVGVRVACDLEQRDEDILQQLLKIFNDALRLVDVVQPRDLHHKTYI